MKARYEMFQLDLFKLSEVLISLISDLGIMKQLEATVCVGIEAGARAHLFAFWL